MKNRLEIAKELLSWDGSIYVNIDYNQVHYLKVLMDEVFGEDNFQREIIWRMGFLSGYKTAVNNFIRNHDTILFYSKDPKLLDFKKTYIDNKDFKEQLKKSNDLVKFMKKYGLEENQVDEILQYINHDSRGERYPLEDTRNCNKWDDLNSIAIDSSTSKVEETVDLDGENFKGQKPEKLLKRIIESATDEGDYVLDFFGGTGTTAAAAHKMNRRYIVCEQMDYINETIVPRMIDVINGDTSGISEAVDWKGGGEFIYFELKKYNGEFREKESNQIISSGYVIESLETALWGFYHSTCFEDGLKMVIDKGGDADTAGCIYGYLAGGYYGYNAIADYLKQGVASKDFIRHTAEELYNHEYKEYDLSKIQPVVIGEHETRTWTNVLED